MCAMRLKVSDLCVQGSGLRHTHYAIRQKTYASGNQTND